MRGRVSGSQARSAPPCPEYGGSRWRAGPRSLSAPGEGPGRTPRCRRRSRHGTTRSLQFLLLATSGPPFAHPRTPRSPKRPRGRRAPSSQAAPHCRDDLRPRRSARSAPPEGAPSVPPQPSESRRAAPGRSGRPPGRDGGSPREAESRRCLAGRRLAGRAPTTGSARARRRPRTRSPRLGQSLRSRLSPIATPSRLSPLPVLFASAGRPGENMPAPAVTATPAASPAAGPIMASDPGYGPGQAAITRGRPSPRPSARLHSAQRRPDSGTRGRKPE